MNHSYVLRNGGTIQSFLPPDVYFLPTAGTTPTNQVNGTVLYFQSEVPRDAQLAGTDGIDRMAESVSDTDHGVTGHQPHRRLRVPDRNRPTAAASMLAPIINSTATVSGQHISGYAGGAYASVPVFTAGTGAGTSPTLAANANSNDLSGYLTVTTGTSPAASAVIATGTFGTAYATLPKCVLWPANAAASALSGTAAAYIPVRRGYCVCDPVRRHGARGQHALYLGLHMHPVKP